MVLIGAEYSWWLAPIVFIMVVLGSTAPDYLEIRYRQEVPKKGIKGLVSGDTRYVSKTVFSHRGITHVISIWVGFFYYSYACLFDVTLISWLSYFFDSNSYATSNLWILVPLFGYSYGGLVHLLCDVPNGRGLPIVPVCFRVKLGLWHSDQMELPMIIFIGGLSSYLTANYFGYFGL
ncbi:metal-dependent hydrolase [Vibrio breoganii]